MLSFWVWLFGGGLWNRCSVLVLFWVVLIFLWLIILKVYCFVLCGLVMKKFYFEFGFSLVVLVWVIVMNC